MIERTSYYKQYILEAFLDIDRIFNNVNIKAILETSTGIHFATQSPDVPDCQYFRKKSVVSYDDCSCVPSDTFDPVQISSWKLPHLWTLPPLVFLILSRPTSMHRFCLPRSGIILCLTFRAGYLTSDMLCPAHNVEFRVDVRTYCWDFSLQSL